MSQGIAIMYVGRKDKKVDNVNQSTGGRVWNGLGDVIEVSPLEAQKLKGHPDVWMDVTHLDEIARAKVVTAVREKVRTERRALQQTVQLKDASVDELQEELARRKADGKISVKKSVISVPAIDRRGAEGMSHDGEAASRPRETASVVDAIVAAIGLLDADNATYFEADGSPTKEAVESLLCYQISKSELKAGVAAHTQRLAG